jgi:hypothetical protein
MMMDTPQGSLATIDHPFDRDHRDRVEAPMSDAFHNFLVAYQSVLSRFVFVSLWLPADFPFVTLDYLVANLPRSFIVDHLLETAPWDDHFIKYAQMPAIRRLHTRWFAQLGFGEPGDLERCAAVFLRFCVRQGYAAPTPAQDGQRYLQHHSHAMHYLGQWRSLSSQNLLGRCADSSRLL